VFKPLKLPAHLHPYPPYFVEYLPHFTGENHISAEKHLEAFVNFVDNLEIVHEDIVMRLFSKSLTGEVALWFRLLEPGSIGSWTDFYYVFSKHWGENKCLDQYLDDFCTLKREKEESLTVFNRRFYRTYYDMPLEIRPTEIAAMVYYLMAQHNELVFLLLERKSSSLRNLFEDAQEVEENICASNKIREKAYFEDLHAQELQQKDSEYEADLRQQQEWKHSSDFKQEGYDYEAVLEQQQAGKFISDCESDFSIFAECLKDRYEPEVYNQFEIQVEPMITDDFMNNYIFPVDCYSHDLNIDVSSSSKHFSEEKIIMIDKQDLISREQKDDQFSSKGKVMEEHEAAINVQLFPEDQQVSDFCFKDPVAVFIECYISENLKASDFLNLSVFPSEFGFVNNFLSFLLHFKRRLLISVNDEIISVLKLLGWLLWKSTFT
jgi:hypothetical protein